MKIRKYFHHLSDRVRENYINDFLGCLTWKIPDLRNLKFCGKTLDISKDTATSWVLPWDFK